MPPTVRFLHCIFSALCRLSSVLVCLLTAHGLGACGDRWRESTPGFAHDAGAPLESDASQSEEEPHDVFDAAAEAEDASQPDAADARDADSAEPLSDADVLDAQSADAYVEDAGSVGQALALRLGSADAVTRTTRLVSSPSGDIFVVGSTNGVIDVQGRRGALDALIARIHADGRVAWVRQLGDVGAPPGIVVKAWDAALTRVGDLIVVGLVNGRPSFQGQPLTSTYSGFVAAFSAEGEQRWLKLLAGSDGSTEAMGVQVLADDAIVVVGYTTAGSLHGATTLGAGDVFLSWLSASGELGHTRRYGSANEEYPTAVRASGGSLYLGYKVAPVAAPAQELNIIKLGPTGEIEFSTALEDPSRTEVAGLAATDGGVCAALQLRTYSPEAGAGADYGLRCYDDQLKEQRSTRAGAPGAQALVQAIACDGPGACVLAGSVDAWFAGESLGAGVAAFAVGFGPEGTQLFTRRFHPDAAPGLESFTRATAVALDEAGKFILAGETNAALFGPGLGVFDGFVTRLE